MSNELMVFFLAEILFFIMLVVGLFSEDSDIFQQLPWYLLVPFVPVWFFCKMFDTVRDLAKYGR